MKPGRWSGSLRVRLLAATLAVLMLALVAAGFLLSGLFHDHVMRQAETTLTQQLDQVTARLVFDATGQPRLDAQALSDPRWQRPYSGLYWQIDQMPSSPGSGGQRKGVLRSRSLWDTSLALDNDSLGDGAVHRHTGAGPQGAPLLILERTVRPDEQPQARWRLVVATDMQLVSQAVSRFNGMLAVSLGLLGLLLGLAGVAQVVVGLSPLWAMQRALVDVREGRTPRLQGRFPTEVQPLIDDFNGVLDRNAEVLERARTQAGNLAHALKTPLAVLGQAASQQQATSPDDKLAPLVHEQVNTARRHIDWHLARARAAAAQGLPGMRTLLEPTLAGLVRVMTRVHADRGVSVHTDVPDTSLAFAGEEQDLQEMLGNLLDNACQWARSAVQVSACRAGTQLHIVLEDDGPGIPANRVDAVLARGVRLDESTPGSGLGLAIVADLAQSYGGQITLAPSSLLGGLRVQLNLPARD